MRAQSNERRAAEHRESKANSEPVASVSYLEAHQTEETDPGKDEREHGKQHEHPHAERQGLRHERRWPHGRQPVDDNARIEARSLRLRRPPQWPADRPMYES